MSPSTNGLVGLRPLPTEQVQRTKDEGLAGTSSWSLVAAGSALLFPTLAAESGEA